MVENTIAMILVCVELSILCTSDDSQKREDDRDQFEVKWGGVNKLHTSSVEKLPRMYLLAVRKLTYFEIYFTRKVTSKNQ